MKAPMTCPVCGESNTREYWVESVGTVEDYYFCERCGYFHEMAYSPYHEGIMLLRTPIRIVRQIAVLIKNRKKLNGLKFDCCHF